MFNLFSSLILEQVQQNRWCAVSEGWRRMAVSWTINEGPYDIYAIQWTRHSLCNAIYNVLHVINTLVKLLLYDALGLAFRVFSGILNVWFIWVLHYIALTYKHIDCIVNSSYILQCYGLFLFTSPKWCGMICPTCNYHASCFVNNSMGCFVYGMFCPFDVLSTDDLSTGWFVHVMFCPRMTCPRDVLSMWCFVHGWLVHGMICPWDVLSTGWLVWLLLKHVSGLVFCSKSK